jgi:hypothetical protein
MKGRNRTATQVLNDTARYCRRFALDRALSGTYSDRFMYAVHRASSKPNMLPGKLAERAVRWTDQLERLSVYRKAKKAPP